MTAVLLLAVSCVSDGDPRPVDSGVPDDTGVMPVDGDGDGHLMGVDDCDDTDPNVYLGAAENGGNGVDEDCDGSDVGAVKPLKDAASIWDGSEWSEYGNRVDAVGDVDGDGAPDFAVSAPWRVYVGKGEGNSSPGVVYLQTAAAGVGTAIDAFAMVPAYAGSAGLAESGVSGGVDVNLDGYDDLLVGASGYFDQTTSPGHAMLFLGPLEGKLDPGLVGIELTTEWTNARFGTGVALIDGAGVEERFVAVAAPAGGADGTGEVYVWRGQPPDGALGEDADLTFVAENPGDLHGADLDGAVDLGGTGATHLVILAANRQVHAANGGAVYIVQVGESGTFGLSDVGLELWSDQEESSVGEALAVDANGDGHLDLVVGGYTDPESYSLGGRVWLIPGPVSEGGELDSLASASISAEGSDELLGVALASPGDLDGDGRPDLAIAAPGRYDHGGAVAGKVYLFPGTIEGTLSGADAAWVLQGEAFGDTAGGGLAGGFDADGDGWGDLVVGASGHDAGGYQAGRVYLMNGLAW